MNSLDTTIIEEYEIYISYNFTIKDKVLNLYDQIKSYKVSNRIFLDKYEFKSGSIFNNEYKLGILNSKLIICCLTNDYLKSSYNFNELLYSIQLNKTILILLYDTSHSLQHNLRLIHPNISQFVKILIKNDLIDDEVFVSIRALLGKTNNQNINTSVLKPNFDLLSLNIRKSSKYPHLNDIFRSKSYTLTKHTCENCWLYIGCNKCDTKLKNSIKRHDMKCNVCTWGDKKSNLEESKHFDSKVTCKLCSNSNYCAHIKLWIESYCPQCWKNLGCSKCDRFYDRVKSSIKHEFTVKLI
jgi:hypothetical protein